MIRPIKNGSIEIVGIRHFCVVEGTDFLGTEGTEKKFHGRVLKVFAPAVIYLFNQLFNHPTVLLCYMPIMEKRPIHQNFGNDLNKNIEKILENF